MNATGIAVSVGLIAASLCAPAAGAQEPQAATPQQPPLLRGAQPARPPSPAEVQSIVDGWVVVQAQTALSLTDAQFPPFVTRLRALQETRRRNQRARMQLIQELGRLTNPKNPTTDEAALRDKLKALDDLDLKSAAELRKAYESIDEVLDLRQRARFRVFLEQVERRMLDILTRARGQAALKPLGRARGGAPEP